MNLKKALQMSLSMPDELITPADFKTARLVRGWSQEKLANIAGVNVKTVQELEYGRRKNPYAINHVRQALTSE